MEPQFDGYEHVFVGMANEEDCLRCCLKFSCSEKTCDGHE